MKFTTEEQRTIRFALEEMRSVQYAQHIDYAILEKLINRFPAIPQRATPSIPEPTAPKPSPEAHDATGESNTKITPYHEGYFVHARRKSPFNFYIVEYLEDHAQAELLCDQLDTDDTARNLAIREAKNYDFYLKQTTVKRERQPREPKEPPVHFSFLD